MNRADRASLLLVKRLLVKRLLASLLLGIITPVWPMVATAHPVPDLIKQSRAPTVRNPIQENQIRSILNAMETAASQKNVDGILKYMAPQITINVTVQLGSGSQQISLSREQYRQYLQQGFETTQRRSGNYTNLKIQIAPSGQTATATYTLVEAATIKGQPGTFVSTSQETVRFERIKGQLLETAATSKAAIEVK